MPRPSRQKKVLEVLKTVRFPGLSRDIVSFGFVKDLAVGGGNVSMRLEIMTESAARPRRSGATRPRSSARCRAFTPSRSGSRSSRRPRRPARGPAAPAAQPAILPEVRYKVAVASGKGGVGKSTVAANLALALERVWARVGLMDSDIYGPSQQMMMGISEKPFVNELNQHRADRPIRRPRHVARLPDGRGPAGDLARADGHEGRRAVPPGRRAGGSSIFSSSTCRPGRATPS